MFILCNTCGNKPSGISWSWTNCAFDVTSYWLNVSRCRLRQPGLCALLQQLNHPACGYTLCFIIRWYSHAFTSYLKLGNLRKLVVQSLLHRATMASTSLEFSAVGNRICADRGWPSSSRRSSLCLLSVQHGSHNLPCISDFGPYIIARSTFFIIHHHLWQSTRV